MNGSAGAYDISLHLSNSMSVGLFDGAIMQSPYSVPQPKPLSPLAFAYVAAACACMLHVARCVLHVACCMLHVVCLVQAFSSISCNVTEAFSEIVADNLCKGKSLR